jgi:hypothetical protein
VARSTSLDLLDRLAVSYLVLPLPIFLFGWLEIWAAVPLALCVAYSLKSLAASPPAERRPVSGTQLAVAAAVGCAWTAFGGTGHLVFANADWHLRDAVLHDLVAGPWPVGYGVLEGRESMLRAPIGYYLPAALFGKWAGLPAAHVALAAWTAAGAVLFLIQVLSQTSPQPGGVPGRLAAALGAAAIIVLFSGLDVIGIWLRARDAFAHWDVTRHLEWWAGSYQYSSMTTQLFWVPNHALGGWLTVGLLMRTAGRRPVVEAGRAGVPWSAGAAASASGPPSADLEEVLPVVTAALALWSPLTALGAVPFVLCRLAGSMRRERSLRLVDPRIWVPALAVGAVVAAYLTLDAGKIPKGWIIGRSGAVTLDLLRHAEFFLLEAGLIGAAILAIRASREVVLALVILALLPLVSFGAANDFAMRVSIPSLAVLAIAACRALTGTVPGRTVSVKRGILAGLLAVGAVTPLQEIARAVVLDRWPVNLDATLIEAACGEYPPHYVARLDGQAIGHVLRAAHALPPGSRDAASCVNPALRLLKSRAMQSVSGGTP